MNQLTQSNSHQMELRTDLLKQAAVMSTALDQLFAGEESKVLKARRIMGASVKDTPDEELEIYLTEFQYMIDYFLDEFERAAFGGLTLRQILQEG